MSCNSPPSVPQDVLYEIFLYLSPYALGKDGYQISGRNMTTARTALAQCARVSHAFHTPAAQVLWKERPFLDVLCNLLPGLLLANIVPRDGKPRVGDDSVEELISEDDRDWPQGNEKYQYYTLPGPISVKQWARFKHYAQFIQRLEYQLHADVDPTVFLFLSLHTGGKPLFPNLRELTWEYAIPELTAVISPTLRTLNLYFENHTGENFDRPDELAYRMRRHTFKMLLPSMLERLPELRELYLRPLGHEGFFDMCMNGPNHRFPARNIRILTITEPLSVLMKGALPAISTISPLEDLTVATSSQFRADMCTEVPSHPDWNKAAIGKFWRLRRLRVQASFASMAVLTDAIAAPHLQTFEFERMDPHLTEECVPAHRAAIFNRRLPLLRKAFATLCHRNAASLEVLKLTLYRFNLPRQRPTDPEANSPFIWLVKQLLRLQNLRELDLGAHSGKSSIAYASLANLVTAWPKLEVLRLPMLVVPLSSLPIVASTCPNLRSLGIATLTPLDVPQNNAVVPSPGSECANGLQELLLYVPEHALPDTVPIKEIARFIHEHLTRLRTFRKEPRLLSRIAFSASERTWLDITEQVRKLQTS